MSPRQERVRQLEDGAMSIGRDPGSGWVLEDPTDVVSGSHCIVERAGGRWYLQDTSRNGTYVNDAAEPIGRHRRVEIADGDMFKAGDFMIQARLLPDAPPVQIKPAMSLPGNAPGMADILQLIPTEGRGSGIVPQDATRPLDEPLPTNLPLDRHAVPPHNPALDWIEQKLAHAGDRRAGGSEQLDVEVAAPERRDAPGAADALAELLEGAGLAKPDLGQAPPEMVLRLAGALLREAVQGVIATLATRALIRTELRVRRTLMGPSDNNVLKFSTNADDALAKLLQGPRRGHAEPTAAMRDAFADLREHELAVMGALQATLRAMLDRIDPERIAQEAEGGLAPLRASRHWAEYRRRFDELSRELQDDFHRGLGRDFARAYEAHSARSAAGGPKAGTS